MTRKTFTESVDAYIAANTSWLSEDHPAVVTLAALAAVLDTEITAAMVAQFGVTFRALDKERPSAPSEADPVGDLINHARNN